MDDRINFIFGKDALHCSCVRRVGGIAPQPLSDEPFKARHDSAVTVGKVINEHDLLTGCRQLHCRMRADKARAARQ